MAKNRRYRWRGFGEQARNPPKKKQQTFQIADPAAPMTGKQQTFLRNLCRRHGVEMPTGLSKRQASVMIDKLLNGQPLGTDTTQRPRRDLGGANGEMKRNPWVTRQQAIEITDARLRMR